MISQILIAILGAATVLLSIWAAYKFHSVSCRRSEDTNRLSMALTFQLIGEAVIGLGTLTFSVGAATGWLQDWSEDTQSAIRFVMFASTSATTYHLVKTCESLKGE